MPDANKIHKFCPTCGAVVGCIDAPAEVKPAPVPLAPPVQEPQILPPVEPAQLKAPAPVAAKPAPKKTVGQPPRPMKPAPAAPAKYRRL